MQHNDSHGNDNRFLFSIPEFAALHAISRTQAYREIAAGRLIASKVGKRTVITAEKAAEWRGSLPTYVRRAA
jgi:hypothetical protein